MSSASATSGTGVSSGRLDMLGGVADYSGSTVLEVATRVTTTATAKLVADSGDKGFAILRSTPFGECKLSLAGLRDTASIEYAAVRATLKDAGAPHWSHYVYGCIAVFAKHTGWLPPADVALEIDIHSEVPTAQGCSSSASVRGRRPGRDAYCWCTSRLPTPRLCACAMLSYLLAGGVRDPAGPALAVRLHRDKRPARALGPGGRESRRRRALRAYGPGAQQWGWGWRWGWGCTGIDRCSSSSKRSRGLARCPPRVGRMLLFSSALESRCHCHRPHHWHACSLPL